MTEKSQIVAERTRTIDQIKRLFAVVMGYAVTNCVTNMYSLVKSFEAGSGPWHHHSQELGILFAQGLAFASLITLLYLGWERSLDSRYLHPDSKSPPPMGLLFDLVCLGWTASFFVILANTFPAVPRGGPVSVQALSDAQATFARFLIAICAVDTVLLFIQTRVVAPYYHEKVPKEVVGATKIWISINIITAFIIYFALGLKEAVWLGTFNALSVVLVVTHLVRFFVDFMKSYKFYYPTEDTRSASPVPAPA